MATKPIDVRRIDLDRDACRFDTVYLDADYRVAKDIRGDTLVVQRDGPPRRF